MRIREQDKLLRVIIENYNPIKGCCSLTNKELAGYLAIEKLDDERHIVSTQRISQLLRPLRESKKIKVIHNGLKNPNQNEKIIKLIDEEARKEAAEYFFRKREKSC